MKLGIELCHGFIRDPQEPLEETLLRAKGMGAQGGQFKNPTFISATLDKGELREAKETADHLGMYLAAGLGRINPYNTAEMPSFWELGDGSYKKGCEKIIEASAILGSHHLVSQTGGYRGYTLPEPYSTDRFREDVSWENQLEATVKFLKKLAPVLRHYGSTISIETHEEITTWEILRVIEEVGEDVVSVTLDTGNIVSRGEEPIAATKRVAPYIKLLHVKDVLLLESPEGLKRNVRPAGDGVLDFQTMADIVREKNPEALFNIEDHMGEMFISYKNPQWRAGHPDLKDEEIRELERLSRLSYEKIASGDIVPPEIYEKMKFDDLALGRMEKALHYLSPIIKG